MCIRESDLAGASGRRRYGFEGESAQHQLECAAFGPDQQRRGLRSGHQLLAALRHQHVEAHRKKDDQRDRRDEDRGLDAVLGEIAPRQVENLPLAAPAPA